jgi:hypothetical protein
VFKAVLQFYGAGCGLISIDDCMKGRVTDSSLYGSAGSWPASDVDDEFFLFSTDDSCF